MGSTCEAQGKHRHLAGHNMGDATHRQANEFRRLGNAASKGAIPNPTLFCDCYGNGGHGSDLRHHDQRGKSPFAYRLLSFKESPRSIPESRYRLTTGFSVIAGHKRLHQQRIMMIASKSGRAGIIAYAVWWDTGGTLIANKRQQSREIGNRQMFQLIDCIALVCFSVIWFL